MRAKKHSKLLVNCKQCGKEFYTIPSTIKRGKGLYCSRECKYKSMITIVSVKCLICGKEFYAHPSNIERGKGLYCSKRCYTDSKITKTMRHCLVCGKEFDAPPSIIERGGGLYCKEGKVKFYKPDRIMLFKYQDLDHFMQMSAGK